MRNATSMSVRKALIAACASAALSQKERADPMTPTNPISEARDHFFTLKVFVPSKVTCTEDRLRWYFDHAIRGYYKQFAIEGDPIKGMLDCSVVVEKTPLKAETQAAEIERLKKDQYVRFTDTMNKLELDNAMMAQRLKAGELEYMRSKEAEITTLKAKLAKAEEVIKPFAEAAESLTGSEDDDAIIAPAFMNSPPLGECDLVVCCVADLRAAAQFTKEREGL